MSSADLIFTGGPIVTVDANHPNPTHVAVTVGRIIAVGWDVLLGVTLCGDVVFWCASGRHQPEHLVAGCARI
ncbi:hypothetical protein ACIRRA_18590 [Nocardia sp. NPDC101769]|uniref:hypothetical protein n=1 Tax=Nocardia sp. NPDC101769 TaxID=3364333 RepID=UPI00381C3F60